MKKLLKSLKKTNIVFAYVALFNASQVKADSCQELLAISWHKVSLFYGGSGPTYKSALKRFDIHKSLGDRAQNLSPKEKVSLYFEEIDHNYTLALDNESLRLQLREEWLKRALITSVPESYIAYEQQRAREEGHGFIDPTTELDRILEALREAQESSFIRWFDYIMGPDISVPTWLRYILLEDLLKIGIHNTDKKTFSIRTAEVAGPYPELNSEAFGKVYSNLKKYYSNQLEEIAPLDLELISKNLSRSFANIYGHYLSQYADLGANYDLQNTQGRWVKYKKGSKKDAKTLFDSLQEQNTGWCTATSCGTASTQVKDGDFYVYYSKDLSGLETVPRIAIRMQGESIAEIRGREKNQNLDSYISETNILGEKLEDFGAEGERYFKRVSDMKILTEIETRNKNGNELTRKDLRFLYEIDDSIDGFGYLKDPRIKEILNKRDTRSDLANIFDCNANQISFTKEEALSGDITYHHGDLNLYDLKSAEGLSLPQQIKGNLLLSSLKNAEGVKLPHTIGGDLLLSGLESAVGLVLPQFIGSKLDLNTLTSGEGLVIPQHIGGVLELRRLTNAVGLKLPQNFEGSIEIRRLSSGKGLVLPQTIRGDLQLHSLTSLEGLALPQTIGGSLLLNSLKSPEDLRLPLTINGNIELHALINAKGLVIPEGFKGHLDLKGLTSGEGLVLPQHFEGSLSLGGLKNAVGLILPRTIQGNLSLIGLTSPKGLILPEFIGGDFYLQNAGSVEHLIPPKIIGKYIGPSFQQ